jgi:uncharacterized membrane protein YcaP (DUF421 family)
VIDPMWQLGTPPLELAARTVILYALFFGALRVFGKREVGQFTLFDLALILLVANALQPALTGPDDSVTGAAIILITIFALNGAVSALRVRSPLIARLLEFQPTVIGRDGRWLTEVMRRQGITLEDAETALREHGLDRVDSVKQATLEEDGSISIVAEADPDIELSRRGRRPYRHPI